MSEEKFFIGWASEIPEKDRRTVLKGSLALVGAGMVGGAILAHQQRPVGPGMWDQGDIRTFTGIATDAPYAMLRTSDISGSPQTALLACTGKCGVSARIRSYAGQHVQVRGSLIQRGRHAMIAVVDDMDWISPVSSDSSTELSFAQAEHVDDISLVGRIVDSKCWFGAMRPAQGKVHKACAALCIRGGIPPAFLVNDRTGNSNLLIMADNGFAYDDTILPLVADPLRVSGRLERRNDLLFLNAKVSDMMRV